MNDKAMFAQPEEKVISQDIKNPDAYLDKLLKDFTVDDETRERILTIKSLDHKDKVAWLLGLETLEEGEVGTRMEVATGCIIIVITVVVAVVIGTEVVNGVERKIIEQQEKEKQVQKCPKPPKK